MSKFNSLDEYISTFNSDALKVYNELKSIIMNSEYEVKEKLFAGQVAFYIEKNLHKTFHSSPVIVLSFLKDHVNVFASANNKYQIELPEYKFTHKGTMQIKYSGGINKTLLFKLFIESLGETSK